MPKKPSLNQAQKSYISRLSYLIKNNVSFRTLLAHLRSGKNNFVAQKSREESKVYDDKIVTSLEEGFGAIDMIIKNPRTFIKDDEEVVMAGLAKKITAASVRHLASHTEFVHSVDKKGNVIPEKILTVESEEDLQIYENRFVMTLIQKAVIFIEKRYQFIQDHGETRDSDLLLMHGECEIDGSKYEVDNRIKISEPSKDEGKGEHNRDLLARLVRLRERAGFYMTCPFMKGMAGAKPVHNPISITNMLLKSPYYHKAYKLWKFIDAYTKLGVTYNVTEKDERFDEPYFKEIYGLMLADMLTIHSRQTRNKVLAPVKVKKKKITPKVLLNIDDEMLLDFKWNYDQFGGQAGRRVNPLAPTVDEVKEEKARQALKAKQDLEKKKALEAKAEALRKKAMIKEAAEKARAEKERLAAIAREKARQDALAKKEAERILKEEAARKKKEDEDALKREMALLAKARGEVRTIATEDKAKDALLLLGAQEENKVSKEASPFEDIFEETPEVKAKKVSAAILPTIEDMNKTPEATKEAKPVTPIIIPVNKEKKKAKPKAKVAIAPIIAPIKKDEPIAIAAPKEEVKALPSPEIKEEPKEVKPIILAPIKEESKKAAPKKKATPKKKAAPKKKPVIIPVVKEEPKVEPKLVLPVTPKPEKKKWVYTRHKKEDKRDVKVTLKKKGKKLVAQISALPVEPNKK